MGALEKWFVSWRAENGDIPSALRMAAYYALGSAEQLERISQTEAGRRATYWDEVAAENGDTRTQGTLVAKHLDEYPRDPIRQSEVSARNFRLEIKMDYAEGEETVWDFFRSL